MVVNYNVQASKQASKQAKLIYAHFQKLNIDIWR